MLDPIEQLRVLSLWHDLYSWAPTGGFMHFVTDDGNLDDEDIQWCLDKCLRMERDDVTVEEAVVGSSLALSLLAVSREDREMIYANYWSSRGIAGY